MRREIQPPRHGDRILTEAWRVRTERATRERLGAFYLEGVRNFLGALDNHWPVRSLVFSERLLTAGIARSKLRALRRSGVPTASVSPEAFRALSGAARASGVAATAAARVHPLAPCRDGRPCLAIESMQSPGNLGSIMRTAAAVGCRRLILIGDSVDPFDERVLRGSMGSLFRIEIVRTSLPGFLDWIQRDGMHLVGASAEGSKSCLQTQLPDNTVLVLGHERHGLSGAVRDHCESLVSIPMASGVDSLNVAVAAGVLLYSAVQPRFLPAPSSLSRARA